MAREQDHVGLSDCCTQYGDLADYSKTQAAFAAVQGAMK